MRPSLWREGATEQALRALGLPGPVIMASRRSALDLAEEAARSYLADHTPHRLG